MEASQSSSGSAAPWATEQAAAAATAPTGNDNDSDTFAERPEVFVGAAFAGGLALAGVLRWLGNR